MTFNPNQIPDRSSVTRLIAPMLFLVAMLCTYLGYMQGVTADWTYDDARALMGLEKVEDVQTALAYVLEKRHISPTDRPLAMATFLINVNDWEKPLAFRHINTLIHLLNAILLAFVALKIARLIPRLASNAPGFAVALATVWMLHPLLTSSSMMIVQRMVLLSGTFTFIALLTYLHGRAMLESRPNAGYTWMTLGVGFATLLGILAKENAALTPMLIGILEYSVLSLYAPVSHRNLAAWKTLFFISPAIVLLVYIVVTFDTISTSYVIRPFSMGERLLSESVVLLEYVRQILVPDHSTMGPIQDDTFRIRGLNLITVMASLFWLSLPILAIVFRKRAPAFSFAVLFFLVGHILESTIWPLELYFEHRNYIPSLGILGSVVALAWSQKAHWPKAATIAFAAGMAVLLWQTTSTWGNRNLAPLHWAKTHPTSTRAAQTLAAFYQQRGDYQLAAQTILDRYETDPLDAGLALPAIITQCFTKDQSKHTEILRRVTQDAPKLLYNSAAPKVLHSYVDLYKEGKCKVYKPDEIIQIGQGLLTNPGFQYPPVKYTLLNSIARAQQVAGDRNAAIETTKMAFQVVPTLKLAKTIYISLKAGGKEKEAAEFLKTARKLAPENEEQYHEWEQSQMK